MGVFSRAQKARIILLSPRGRAKKMVGKIQNMGPMWKHLLKEVDFENPTPSMDQVCSGCTQRDAIVDPQAVQFGTESVKKPTTTKEIGKDYCLAP